MIEFNDLLKNKAEAHERTKASAGKGKPEDSSSSFTRSKPGTKDASALKKAVQALTIFCYTAQNVCFNRRTSHIRNTRRLRLVLLQLLVTNVEKVPVFVLSPT